MLSILRSSAFRRVAAAAAAFCVVAFLLFAFIYWQTAVIYTRHVNDLITSQAATIARAPTEQMLWTVENGISSSLHRVTLGALFDRSGKRVVGNLRQVPPGLPLDGRPHPVSPAALGVVEPDDRPLSVVGLRLADGGVLVIGRNVEQLDELRVVVTRALELGIIPALLLALGFGILLGHRTNQRIRAAQQVLNRVRDGSLAERLPVRHSGEDFDQLSIGVNHMLGEVERLLGELQNVGNNIAHDLRTPLSRVRTMLERARRTGSTREELAQAIDRAVLGLDQAAGIITALLRIAEIEHRQPGTAMLPVDLAAVAQEAVELYGPIAEAKHIELGLTVAEAPAIQGDHDLLFEALANLLDNAIKFTPEDGRVRLSVKATPPGPVVEVADTGPGIPADRRSQVFARFHRLDKSRHVAGAGLGLSLVQAIARMHGFSIAVGDEAGAGCVVRLMCFGADAPIAAMPL